MHLKNIKIDKDKPQHLYIQLYKMIKRMILKGELKAEDKLPPLRVMAIHLGVNNVTVVKAYEILEQEGLVYKRIGSGTYVSRELANEYEKKDLAHHQQSRDYAFGMIEQGHIAIEGDMINFASGTPSADLFPVDDFKEVLNYVLDRDKGHAFDYQEGKGYYPLRQSLQKYILENSGIKASIDDIQIISGAQQGIDIIAKALINYGDYVFVERPSYIGAMAAFQYRGGRMVDIPLQKEGIDIEALEKKITEYKPKLIYLMPNFQNPTGISYSKERKHQLIKLCKENGVYIVEDDYLSEFNFTNSNNSPLKALDSHQNVIYIKSFSKIFMPGLRLGFLVIPPKLNNNLLMAKHTTDISTSGLLQRALDIYLRKEIWHQHLSFMEEKYRERFVAMEEAIERYIPHNVVFSMPKGGVNFWFKLPKSYSSIELSKRASSKGIALAPGRLFFLKDKDEGYFRLSIASVHKDDIAIGIKALGEIIHEYINKKDEKTTTHIKPIL